MNRDELIGAGFDAAVAAIRSWSENHLSSSMNAALRSAAYDLEKNRQAILSCLQPSGDGEREAIYNAIMDHCGDANGGSVFGADEATDAILALLSPPPAKAAETGYEHALEGALEEWVFLYRWKVDGMPTEQARIHARSFVTEGRAAFFKTLGKEDI